eukprot:5223617-Prymnesium_polylepis.1
MRCPPRASTPPAPRHVRTPVCSRGPVTVAQRHRCEVPRSFQEPAVPRAATMCRSHSSCGWMVANEIDCDRFQRARSVVRGSKLFVLATVSSRSGCVWWAP